PPAPTPSCARADRERPRVDARRVDADGAAHVAVLHDRPDAQAPARPEQELIKRAADHDGKADDEQAREWNRDARGRLPSAGEPRGRRHAALARAEEAPERVLAHQRQAPGGEHRVERPLVEEADEAALKGESE